MACVAFKVCFHGVCRLQLCLHGVCRLLSSSSWRVSPSKFVFRACVAFKVRFDGVCRLQLCIHGVCRHQITLHGVFRILN